MNSPNSTAVDELPALHGHTLGFFDSSEACETMTRALIQAGFPSSTILVFQGPEGIPLLTHLMKGFQWGESAETALRQGTVELTLGHSAVCVQVDGAVAATTVANLSTQLGGHSVYHFGMMIDTQLT